jgi:hypothetical protein
MKHVSFIIPLFVVLFLTACKDETPVGNLEMQFSAKVNNSPLSFDNVLLVDDDSLIFKVFHFYVSEIQISDKDDLQSIELKDVALINFKEAETASINFELEANAYKNPSFLVGLSNALNESDPSSYPSSHPMSLNEGNYWIMSNSYIYFKIEGFRVLNGVQYPFTYHVGLNDYAQLKSLDKAFSINEGNTTTLLANINVNELFENIDFNTEFETHTIGTEVLAQKMMNNFVNALSIQ